MRSSLSRIFVLPLLFVAAILPACGNNGYSQDTPEDTIATARKMVLDGHADRLDRLIYADNEDMRKFLRRFGVFMGNLQKLGSAIKTAYPEDVAKLTAEVEQAAKEGRATSLLGQFTQQARPAINIGVGNKKKQKPSMDSDAFNNAIKEIFVNPYAWLEQSEERLTTEFSTDDSVSLRWDGKPVMAPIGIQMKRADDGKWYFVLPTGIPGVAQFMPKSKDEFQIWGSLVTVFDNAILDLTKDIKTGRVSSLDQVSRKAGEKAFIPAAMVFFAYSKAIEARKKAPQGVTHTGG